jgi:hypothetical protein
MARTADDGNSVALLAAQFEHSGMSRREFCKRHGLALTTLDYYRYRERRKKAGSPVSVRLLPVNVRSGDGPVNRDSVAVVLANGRRIEFRQEFTEAELAQLLRTVEQA